MLKSKIRRISAVFDEFLYTPTFPAVISAFILLAYILRADLIGLSVLVVIACFIMIRKDDITPLLPLCFGFVCLFRGFDAVKGAALYIILAPFVLSIVYHFIRFSVRKVTLGKLFFPFFLLTSALFFSGIFSAYLDLYPNGLLYCITVGPLLWFAYFLFTNYVRPPEDFDLKSYLAFSVVSSVLIMCLAFFAECVEQNIGSDTFTVDGVTVGFGNTNNVGTMTLLAIPLCLFLIVRTGKIWVYLVLALFFTVTVFLLRCDGGSGIVLAFSPFLFAFTCLKLKGKSRKKFIYCTISVVLCVATAFLVVLYVKGYEFMREQFYARINESGRSPLYELALKLFKENPVFGAGLGYSDTGVYGDYSPHNGALRIFNFHSTIFQVMGCMGLFGLIAYAVYFYKRYEIVLENPSDFNLFIFFAFTMFECYGIIDTCEFNVIPCMLTLTLMITVTETENRKIAPVFKGTINAFGK